MAEGLAEGTKEPTGRQYTFGSADRLLSSSSSTSSSTKNSASQNGASAIHSSTHLLYEENLLSHAAVATSNSQKDTLKRTDDATLELLDDITARKDVIPSSRESEIGRRKEALNVALPLQTEAPSSGRTHVTEADLQAAFGTTLGDEALTEISVNSLHRTSTVAPDSLTQVNQQNILPTTAAPGETLTETRTNRPMEITTPGADTLTVSAATTASDESQPLTETAPKSSTASSYSDGHFTTGDLHTGSSTEKTTEAESVTLADRTDSTHREGDFRIPSTKVAPVEMTTESRVHVDQDGLFQSNQADFASTAMPVNLATADGNYVEAPVEDKADVDHESDSSDTDDEPLHDSPQPTELPSETGPLVALPERQGAATKAPKDGPEETSNERTTDAAPRQTSEERQDDSITTDETKNFASMTTIETTTSLPERTEDSESVTQKNPDVTTPETLEEKETGFFRCTDGTIIAIESLCDRKGDCPDFSDEDMCDPEEKANLTEQIHRPTSLWNEEKKEGTNEEIISLDGESDTQAVEQSHTEAPTMFTCLGDGSTIPWSAVCDKRGDCDDYSDEFDCDGSKHVTTDATITTESSAKSWTMRPKLDLSPKIEVLDEEDEIEELFRCLDGSAVVPMSAVCDKKWDCLDFSDEDECDAKGKLNISKPAKQKPSMSWAKTESRLHLPDRETNMIIEEVSEAKGSLPEYWRCENGNYIFISSVCDKKDDCGDFSDEDDCIGNRKVPTTEAPPITVATTMNASIHVESGTLAVTTPVSSTVQSTPAHLTLFQSGDVKAWSEEVTPMMDILHGQRFPTAMFTCNDGEEIEAIRVCDYEVDCFDGSDEDDCYDGWDDERHLRFEREVGSGTGPTPIECGTGFFQCNDETCIDESLLCNGVFDCLEGEDESDVNCAGACPFPSLNERVILAVGSQAQSRYRDGTNLTLACTRGSTLQGSLMITCINGTFTDGTQCLRMCHIDPNRNALTCSADTYEHGTSPNCSCSDGYNLEIANADITCNDTMFIPTHPQCEETNECLLPVSPCDINAECFNMPLGSFQCVCFDGYSGDGTVCSDINECVLGTAVCDPDANCTNTEGSYICTCNEGLIGDGVTSCVEPIYFDYGMTYGDDVISTAIATKIDGYVISIPLQRRRLFPVGDQLYRYFHITNTGMVAFSNIMSVDMTEFAHPSTFTDTSGQPAVAVFGISSYTGEADSDVFYQIYEDTDTSTQAQTLLSGVASLINNADTTDTRLTTTFSAKWAVLITWSNLRRWGTMPQSAETNTFQAVLTTDGIRGFALFQYQELSLLWDESQLTTDEFPIIGFRSNLEFYDLQSDNSYTRAQMFRPDQLEGNIPIAGTAGRRKRATESNELGKFVYRLDRNADDFINPAEYCVSWYDNTRTLSRNTPGVLPCPCTRLQAMNDERFKQCTPYTSGFGLPEVDPYPDSLTNSDSCVQQVFPAIDGSGSRCVYYRNESLVVGYNTMWESSQMQSVLVSTWSFSFLFLQWGIDDVLPRYYCCSQSADPYFCDLYNDRRPRRSCNSYTPPGLAWGQGDPHIRTHDSFSYTFNGLGEYTMVRIPSTGFELQGRTGKAFDSDLQVTDTGTVFTGFAAEYGVTKVEFVLNSERANLTIIINGTEEFLANDLLASPFVSGDPLFDLRYDASETNTTGARFIATFREDLSSANDVSLNVGLNLRMLDFAFSKSEAYVNRTTGLYGIWNGDPTDDIVNPNGTVVPNAMSLTDEELYTYGELWRVNSSTSLFTYGSNETWATYNPTSFTPLFIESLNQSVALNNPGFYSQAKASCSGSQNHLFEACIYDALATNDVTIGENTIMIGNTREQEAQDLENFPPILNNITEISSDADVPAINVNGVLNLIVNKTYMFQASGEDANGDTIEYSLQGDVPPEAAIDPLTGVFTYQPSGLSQISIGILASDGVVSRFLQLLIVLCHCENNGTCDFTTMTEGYNLNNDKFAIAQCDCAQGWTGQRCNNDFDSCELNPCYPGVTCIDYPAPSITPACSSCPPNLAGDGYQCWDLDECAEGLDECEQICGNTLGSYTCSCRGGYELTPNMKDCIDINECDRATDDCSENAVCNNTIGSYTCRCNDGYRLTADNRTCVDVDECTIDLPCDTNADCANVEGSYTCSCRSGYQGTGLVCEDINECFNPMLNDCDELADCVNIEGYFICNCITGYEGTGLNCTDRNECLEGVSQCSMNAECVNVPGSFQCGCNAGYTGDGNTCIDFDECSDSAFNDCDVNAECQNEVGSYTCACNTGFSGNGTSCSDINECEGVPAPCSAQGSCTNTEGTYRCACNDGYSGDGFVCQDINECSQNIDDCTQRCINLEPGYQCGCDPGFQLSADNSTCEVASGMECDVALDPCTGGGMCLNATGLITCVCPRGYNNSNATNCEDIDECLEMTDNCDPTEGLCSNTEGGYTCSCNSGYTLGTDLRSCSDINECDSGNNNCSINAACNNTAGGYECSCNPGFSGDGTTCSNFNECDSSPCVANSDCTDTEGSYVCTCSPGYVGDQTFGCFDINECLSVPCDINADCVNFEGSYNCTCHSGYYGNGTACYDIKECEDPNLCPENSYCMELGGSYTCVCNEGYMGDGTEPCVDIDECFQNPEYCHNDAICTNFPGNYSCDCMVGYSGDGVNCTDVNECELGTIDCDVNSNCTNTKGSYTCNCLDGWFDSTGSRAEAGSCLDVDECALQVDSCGANSMCVNTNGSYECVCDSGYMASSARTCEDIAECSQTPNPCDDIMNTICLEADGSYQCVCQASTFNIDGMCQAAHTLFLMVEFVDIQGLVVEFYYSIVSTDQYLEALANDTIVILRASTLFSDVFAVSVQQITLAGNGTRAEIIYRVDIPLSNDATEAELAETFDDALIGTRTDILPPDNRVYVETVIEVDMNECSNASICPVNSMCINNVGSYRCQCDPGYEFVTSANRSCGDINECELGICSVNAQCNNSIGGYSCVCNEGYTGNGLTCSDINECDLANVCGANSVCNNTDGSYSCSCQTGFTGSPPGSVCTDIDECADPATCTGMNEECVNTAGSYECVCMDGTIRYLGYCLFFEELSGQIRYNRISGTPVDYNSSLADPSSAYYQYQSETVCAVFSSQIDVWLNLNVPYTYLSCNVTGFSAGSIIAFFSLNVFGESQSEALERTGVIYDNGFSSTEMTEWTGTDGTILYLDFLSFEDPANASCSVNPCLNGGTCQVDYDDAVTRCACPPGFSGSICENNTACLGHDCVNGGECLVDANGNPYCSCPADYTGTFCELLVACETLDCVNNGTCELDGETGQPYCRCPDGYTGTRCENIVTSGLSVGAIVGIVLGVVGFVLIVILLCFCCLILFAARRRRQRKLALFEGEENWGYAGPRRLYAPAAPAPTRSSVVRNDPSEFASTSSDDFYYYQNTRGRPFAGAQPRPILEFDDDDDDTIDSRFSGIVKNMWNMHADQRPTTFDPRELPTSSNFLAAGGIPRASVQARALYPEFSSGFERPYVADGTESNAYSEETEEFRSYRGRPGRDKGMSRGFEPYNYF
ncbi:uncharacterized protein [Diadema setosum]|uniref:uncharacterized protein n=1 Tax=Diadema setosum TaxID=31175 RepID=UPI003B3AC85A